VPPNGGNYWPYGSYPSSGNDKRTSPSAHAGSKSRGSTVGLAVGITVIVVFALILLVRRYGRPRIREAPPSPEGPNDIKRLRAGIWRPFSPGLVTRDHVGFFMGTFPFSFMCTSAVFISPGQHETARERLGPSEEVRSGNNGGNACASGGDRRDCG